MSAFTMVTLVCDSRGCGEEVSLPVLKHERARVAAGVQGWSSKRRSGIIEDFCPAHSRRRAAVSKAEGKNA